MAEEIKPNGPGVIFRETPQPTSKEETKPGVASGMQTPEMKEEIKNPPKEPPFTYYERLRGRPYSVDYFNLGLNWWFSNFPQEIETIEGFVRDEIQKYSLENSTQSYRDILAKLESVIGIKPTERGWKKMDRLVGYIKARQQADKWAKKKSEMEVKFNGST